MILSESRSYPDLVITNRVNSGLSGLLGVFAVQHAVRDSIHGTDPVLILTVVKLPRPESPVDAEVTINRRKVVSSVRAQSGAFGNHGHSAHQVAEWVIEPAVALVIFPVNVPDPIWKWKLVGLPAGHNGNRGHFVQHHVMVVNGLDPVSAFSCPKPEWLVMVRLPKRLNAIRNIANPG